MFHTRLTRRFSGLLVLMFLLAACGQAATPTTAPKAAATTAPSAAATKPATNQVATGKEITIGLFGPMSGNAAQNGTHFRQAVALAVDEVNKSGGVNNRPVKVVEADDRLDPKEAANIAQKFSSDPEMMAVIGGFSSTASLAAAPIYQKAGIVQLCPTCSHPDFGKDGNYTFSLSNPQTDEGPFNAKFTMNTLGKKKVAVLWRKDDWGQSASAAYEQALKEIGGEVVLSESVADGTQDFKPVLTKIKNANPDAIYVALYYTEAALMAQQAKQLDLQSTIVSSGSLYNIQFLNLAAGAADGWYLPTAFFPEAPKSKEFAEKYKERYNMEADNFAAHAYDSATLLLAAMKNSDLTRASIRDSLMATSKGFEGLTGVLTFDENRRVHKELTWLRVQNGQFILHK